MATKGSQNMESPHTSCIEHSGIRARLTWNLLLNGLGVLLVSFLLYQTTAIRSENAVAQSERNQIKTEMTQMKAEYKDLDTRMRILEGRYPTP